MGVFAKLTLAQDRLCNEAVAQDKSVMDEVIMLTSVEETELIDVFAKHTSAQATFWNEAEDRFGMKTVTGADSGTIDYWNIHITLW